MKRRQLVAGLVTLPVVLANLSMPAMAQAPMRVSARGGGHTARTQRTGRGFLLEVSGLRLGLEFPADNRLGNFEIQDLMMRPAEVGLNGSRASITLRQANQASYTGLGGGAEGSGGIRLQTIGADTAEGFLVIVVTSLASILGPDGLRDGGRGTVDLGGTSVNFLLEVSG